MATYPFIYQTRQDMSKGLDSKKNSKKKPLKTVAEKRADKRAKKIQADIN
ncbi:hypothetical protein JFY74_11610 [Pectobacterium carotovorum]|nr:hypothetical protein JFY74_11610 [Pectobacterium carotovorum]